MVTEPIATILANQHPSGYWVKPGAGYSPKYTSTVWQLIFLDQLGADPNDARIQAACEYVLAHTQASSGGFGASGNKHPDVLPPPSRVVHCLNGNLVRALIGFGYLDDERLRRAIEWEVQAIIGRPTFGFHASGTSGPDFRCGANDGLPCAWGAAKAMFALARIPPDRRTADAREALDRGVSLLLGVDPAAFLFDEALTACRRCLEV